MMMLRLATLLLAISAGAADAHDFWLQPVQWNPGHGAPLEVTLQVGHGPDRQRSPIRASRILLMETVAPDGSSRDLHSGLHLGNPSSDLTVSEDVPPAMIVLSTDVIAQSHLSAQLFNQHLREEGLAEAIAWRAEHQLSQLEGSENYGRVAKMLLPGASTPATARQPLGLELEIVPLADPYADGSEQFPVRVFARSKPLGGVTVKLYELARDSAPATTCVTGVDGSCSFRFERRGSWLVNVVRSVANPPGSPTDFRTIFSSLSFGFDSEVGEARQ